MAKKSIPYLVLREAIDRQISEHNGNTIVKQSQHKDGVHSFGQHEETKPPSWHCFPHGVQLQDCGQDEYIQPGEYDLSPENILSILCQPLQHRKDVEEACGVYERTSVPWRVVIQSRAGQHGVTTWQLVRSHSVQ